MNHELGLKITKWKWNSKKRYHRLDIENTDVLYRFHCLMDISDQEIGTFLIALMKDQYLMIPGLEEINRVSILGRNRMKKDNDVILAMKKIENVHYEMADHVTRRYDERKVGSRTFPKSTCTGQLYWEYKKTPFDVIIEDYRCEWKLANPLLS